MKLKPYNSIFQKKQFEIYIYIYRYFWKATAQWNIKVGKISEKEELQLKKNEYKSSTLYLKQLKLAKVDHKNLNPFVS